MLVDIIVFCLVSTTLIMSSVALFVAFASGLQGVAEASFCMALIAGWLAATASIATDAFLPPEFFSVHLPDLVNCRKLLFLSGFFLIAGSSLTATIAFMMSRSKPAD